MQYLTTLIGIFALLSLSVQAVPMAASGYGVLDARVDWPNDEEVQCNFDPYGDLNKHLGITDAKPIIKDLRATPDQVDEIVEGMMMMKNVGQLSFEVSNHQGGIFHVRHGDAADIIEKMMQYCGDIKTPGRLWKWTSKQYAYEIGVYTN